MLPRSCNLHHSGVPLTPASAMRARKCSTLCVVLCVTLLLVASLQLFLSQRTSAALNLAPASLALATVAVDVPRLESNLRYQQSIVSHLRDLISKECVRQLRQFGWGDDQIASEKAIMATWSNELLAPNSPFPRLSWNNEQQENFHTLGCMNAILYPRAVSAVKRNYQQLVDQYEASLAERARRRNGTILNTATGQLVNRHGWRMERGLYSAKYRREGRCGVELRCVIALSLYGSSPRYTVAIQSSVLRLPRIFPGWELRVYFDHTVPPEILRKLRAHEKAAAAPGADHTTLAKLELVNVTSTVWPVGSPELERISGAFYRFLVADDPTVDRWISRDCDALLFERDAAAVNEWLESGWSFHTMADFPQHGSMLAGMWGGVNYARENGTVTLADGTKSVQRVGMIADAFGGRTMQRLIEDFTQQLTVPNRFDSTLPPNPKFYGCDQSFQMDVILPVLQIDYIGHDSYHCHEARNSFSFPLQRPEPYVFIGQTQTTGEDGSTEMDGMERSEPAWELPFKRPSPVECRRKPEWIYG